jgi:hypothetical protein
MAFIGSKEVGGESVPAETCAPASNQLRIGRIWLVRSLPQLARSATPCSYSTITDRMNADSPSASHGEVRDLSEFVNLPEYVSSEVGFIFVGLIEGCSGRSAVHHRLKPPDLEQVVTETAAYPQARNVGDPFSIGATRDQEHRPAAQGIAIIRAIWNGQGSLRYDGKYYSLRGLQPGPRPTHTMGIWVGAVGEQMLHLTGRLADGWAAPIVSYLPYERWAWAQETIDHGAHQAGRDPSSILRVANLVGSITNRRGNGQPRGNTPLEGKSAYWIEVLTSLAIATRFDAFIFWPEVSSSEQIERFAHEVAPGVREAVARE